MGEIIIPCPFIDEFQEDIDCIYMQEGEGLCRGIDINPGNGDAWCSEMIRCGIEWRNQP